MRKHRALQLAAANPILLISISLVLFFILFTSPLSPAHAIRLTYVKHLFDITHKFNQPSDVAVSEKGLIYIVDGVNNKIRVFDNKGGPLFAFGKKGALNKQFNFPLGIHIDSKGKVYVADSGNHRIQIFTPAGDYISQIKIPLNDNNPADPADLVVNESTNKMFITDNDNHYIIEYDLSTNAVTAKYGAPGMEKYEFRYPYLMSADSSNYMYIVDVINTRIQVLNPEGKFVTTIGGWGVEKGKFFRPKGVAVDMHNRIYVSDSYMGVIQIFKPDGAFHSVIGDPETKSVKKFNTPVGLFIDKNSRLYVVEMFASKVGVYSIEEKD